MKDRSGGVGWLDVEESGGEKRRLDGVELAGLSVARVVWTHGENRWRGWGGP